MSTTQWADIGVNLGDKQFRGDADAVLERAREAGVTRMLLTGTSVAESRQALTLCRDYPGRGLRATAGIHPHNARFFDDDALAELAGLLDEPEVTAAGEMGLDFNRDFSPRPDQEKAFEAQLAQAAEGGECNGCWRRGGMVGDRLFLVAADSSTFYSLLFSSTFLDFLIVFG